MNTNKTFCRNASEIFKSDAKKEIDKCIRELIKEYGCAIISMQYDDDSFIKECEKSNHKKYHKRIGYSLEINI